MPDLTIDAVFSAIAERYPDRPCVIEHGRTTTYGQLDVDSRRLASFLLGKGLGARTERCDLAPWRSGQAHVGLLMYNCAEYLVAEFAAVRARAAAINVNYRYVAEELSYLFQDAGLEALVFHSRCASQVAEVRYSLPAAATLVQVPDDSEQGLLPGAIWLADAIVQADPALSAVASPDDLHILYTGGTTGKPKGVMWRQGDILVTGLGGRRADGSENDLAGFLHSADRTASRTLPAGPFMHASGRWTALSQLMLGNVIVLPRDTLHFDPADIWATAEREGASGLNIVGDAMARPLIAELSKGSYRLGSLRMISSGAAVFSQTCKRELLDLLPGIQISDTVGSSETGPQASTIVKSGALAAAGDFGPAKGTTILREDLTGLLPAGSEEAGWLARAGRMPLGYLGDEEKTLRAFRTIDGVRYAVPGDRASWNENGQIQLLGRDSSTINSGGEKIFAEEVEIALKQHPAVQDAVVCGRPSPRWGQEVIAVLALRPGMEADDAALLAECARHVARYKLPKAFIHVGEVKRSISGKPDYAWARQQAEEVQSKVEVETK